MLSLGDLNRKPRAHFIGIGGTAMVAGARLACEAGWEVRGSDNPLYPPTSDMVEALGVEVATGYSAANLDWAPDVVIVGNALSRGNEEVEAALDRKLCYVSLPEWLKEAVLRQRQPVVITGTHGKTTSTAIAASLLDRCGYAPGFLIGGQPLDFPHSARLGAEGAPFVIEGDEYDTAFFDKRAKFFHYLPHIAVVTSLEFDHGDIYKDIDQIENAFRLMLRQIPRSGHLVLNADDPRAAALADHAFCNVTTFGFDDNADWRAELTEQRPDAQHFTVHRGGDAWGKFTFALPGAHNLHNALAAIIVASLHGASPEEIGEALAAFKGVKRRMEIFHEANGITFIDDFAHHPTAIQETIAAAKTRWPDRRLVVLFEPRSNTTSTNRFQTELGASFQGATEVCIGPIHRADAIPAENRLDRQQLVDDIATYGAPARSSDSATEILEHLQSATQPNDIVLILSNGAFGGLYDMIRDAFAS